MQLIYAVRFSTGASGPRLYVCRIRAHLLRSGEQFRLEGFGDAQHRSSRDSIRGATDSGSARAMAPRTGELKKCIWQPSLAYPACVPFRSQIICVG